jgi:hypothetical protein
MISQIKPPFRKLRGYAFDPSLSLKIDTAFINDIVYKVYWEDKCLPGPKGEYLEVIDYDPTVKKFYEPVCLDDKYILAQDGLSPSESNPQFHQQMVYAVAMTTIKNFEKALGRLVLWSPNKTVVSTTPAAVKKVNRGTQNSTKIRDEYIGQLRIYPHAFRDANAYYSPQKKALLFGYFSAQPAEITLQMPNSLVFTCLSHDIIAHETTHAILDGLYRKYIEDTNPDMLAFHEAFADIVALFQHFTFPEVLKHQIAKTRGDLASQNLLGELAMEFGTAIGNYGSLRDAIGYFEKGSNKWRPKEPNGEEYRTVMEPHARGSILVAAVFDAFLTIYKTRIADLTRIASGGSGVLPQGELHPDLVNRFASEASKSAAHVLGMCIRALDYLPPVDITFGDYLRAIITADVDLVADDEKDYRIAFIDAFRKRGIYPGGISNLSVQSLCYMKPNVNEGLNDLFNILIDFLRDFRQEIIYINDRQLIFEKTRDYIAGRYDEQPVIQGLHRRINSKFDNEIDFEKITGLVFNNAWKSLGVSTSHSYSNIGPSFEVHSLHLASRVGPDGNQSNQIIVSLIQKAGVTVNDDNISAVVTPFDADGKKPEGAFFLSGGCTLIFDLDTMKLKYAIGKPLLDQDELALGRHTLCQTRCLQLYRYYKEGLVTESSFDAYFSMGKQFSVNEPFAFLHAH